MAGSQKAGSSGYQLPSNGLSQDQLRELLQNNPEFRQRYIAFARVIVILLILVMIDTILKGFAMWKASKNDSKAWFWALLLGSSMGILPIIYLIIDHYSKKKKK